MRTVINKKDVVIVRYLNCYLIKDKTIQQITRGSFLKLRGYKMIDLKSEFWGNNAQNFIVNNHYELEVEFV